MPLMQNGLTVERSQDRSIHVSTRGYVIYLIIRREAGWKVYPKTTARLPSTKDHATAHLAAKSYLKGNALKSITILGEQIDHEVLVEEANGMSLKFDYGAHHQPGEREHHSFDMADRVWNYAELLKPVHHWCIDQFGPQGIEQSGWQRLEYGFNFSDPVKATAFRVRWC